MRRTCSLLLAAAWVAIAVSVGGCCVAEGTSIATPTGARAVESLTVGDEVLCLADDGTTRTGKVMRLRRHVLPWCLRIRFSDGGDLRVSPWHPIATRHGWTKAGELSRGMEVRGAGGGWVSITDIKTQWGPVRVYDVSVEPYPNFLANNVLVHNKSYPAAIPPGQLPGAWVGPTEGRHPDFCWMELHADGTGVFLNGPHDVYRITRWTIDRYTSPTYGFHAELLPTRDACCQKPGTLSGEVGWGTIRCRASFWYPGLHATLMRVEKLTAELEALRAAASSRATTAPAGP
jgi:hypothetical protein